MRSFDCRTNLVNSNLILKSLSKAFCGGSYRRIGSLLTIFLMVSMSAVAETTPKRDTLLIVGWDGAAWFPYLLDLSVPEGKRSWKKVDLKQNFSSITRLPKTDELVFKGDDGKFYQADSKGRNVRELGALGERDGTKASYTHIRADRETLALVELQEGKSQTTQIGLLSLDAITKNASAIHYPLNQAAAQFHPILTNNFLYYAHVSCRLACKPVIQEIWRQNRVTGLSEQLTLLNATSYPHSLNASETAIYFSSNKRGYYHIGRFDLEASEVQWITDGAVTDSFPSISSAGDLYWIRSTLEGYFLMRSLGAEAAEAAPVESIVTPKAVNKFRYLEISND